MKKTFIIALMLAAGVFITSFVSAQTFTSVQYTMGIPGGGLKNHVDKISWRGATLEFHREVAPSVTVGVNFAWSTFYERKDYASYTQGTRTLTGVQYRYDNLFPMLVNAHYTFGTGTVIPYVGLGMGTMYDLRNTDMGTWTIEEKNWHFLMTPEAGFILDVSPGVSLKVNAKYDYAFKIKDADAFGNMNLNFGFVFNSW
jgi:outer membrane protein